jgi:hypothetical protein
MRTGLNILQGPLNNLEDAVGYTVRCSVEPLAQASGLGYTFSNHAGGFAFDVGAGRVEFGLASDVSSCFAFGQNSFRFAASVGQQFVGLGLRVSDTLGTGLFGVLYLAKKL